MRDIERAKQKHKEWLTNNKERVRQKQIEWRLKNIPGYQPTDKKHGIRKDPVETNKIWRSENKEHIQSYQKAARQTSYEYICSLKDNPCKDCGSKFHYSAMDFDHVRGEKLYDVSTMVCMRKEKIQEEISKCELVCANCHRFRSWQRAQTKII